MFTGKRFRLNKTTLGLDSSGTKQRTVQIPAGSIIQVTGSGTSDVMVAIQWESLKLAMFVIDVQQRGEELTQ